MYYVVLFVCRQNIAAVYYTIHYEVYYSFRIIAST